MSILLTNLWHVVAPAVARLEPGPMDALLGADTCSPARGASATLRAASTRVARSAAVVVTVALLASAMTSGTARADAPARTTQLTLEAAVKRAFEDSPRLRARRAEAAQAEGRLIAARTYPYNPELELEAGARSGSAGSGDSTDRGVALRQEIEVAGQRGRRVAAASAEQAAARSRLRRAERLLAAEVHLAFVGALAAQETLELAREESQLARELLDLTRRRLRAGAATQLDANVAAADFGRAEQTAREAIEGYAVARAILAETVGLDPSVLPVPAGKLDVSQPDLPPLAELIEYAKANRADLEALGHAQRAARARIELARSSAWPNIVVGGFAQREEGTDTIIGGRVSVPLPLFWRNQGEIAQARAAVQRAAAETDTAGLEVVRELVVAYETYRASSRSLETLREHVVGATAENLELLTRTFEAGKAGWADVLVMKRALFDVRRAFLDTMTEAARASITINIAAGRMPLPPQLTSK